MQKGSPLNWINSYNYCRIIFTNIVNLLFKAVHCAIAASLLYVVVAAALVERIVFDRDESPAGEK